MKKAIKVIIPLIFIAVASYIIFTLERGNPLRTLFPLFLIGFFIFNLIVRKSLAYKKYFTSDYNIFTTTVKSKNLYDIPKELMFEKVIEVLDKSNFKIADTNKDKYEILATTNINLKSWGENLYISFKSEGNQTTMMFCSTTLFQIISWGKNDTNIKDLINKIEDSFTI